MYVYVWMDVGGTMCMYVVYDRCTNELTLNPRPSPLAPRQAAREDREELTGLRRAHETAARKAAKLSGERDAAAMEAAALSAQLEGLAERLEAARAANTVLEGRCAEMLTAQVCACRCLYLYLYLGGNFTFPNHILNPTLLTINQPP